ncbi:MAG: alpha/beta fold hydrolase [Byssovorax sp.]
MSLQIDEHGRGERAVVLLHGLPSTVAYFDPLIEALAPDHRVLAVYLPGYGGSAPLPLPYSLDAALASVEDALHEHGVRRAAFVGFSSGAHRMFAIALRGRVAASHLVGLGAVASFTAAEREGFAGFVAALRAGVDLAPIVPGRFLSPASTGDPARVKAVLAWLTAAPLGVVEAELEAFVHAPDLLDALRAIKVPTLLRTGALDVASPPAKAEEIARAIEGATVEIVAGAGHALLIEDGEATARSVQRFLATG